MYAISILACASLTPLAAHAAEQTASQSGDSTTDIRAKVAAEAQVRSDMQRARHDAEAARKDEQHAKIDAEAAQRELDRMREQMRDLSKRMAELSTKLGDVGPRTYAYRYFGDPERGMVGVVLGKDERGLRINAVTPGGPADKAGIKNGDILVIVNDVDVTKPSADPKAAQPLHNLKVGEDVKVTVLRDGKNIAATMKAERREPFNFSFAFNDQGDPGKASNAKRIEELQALGENGAELPPDFDRHVQQQVERATREAQREAERAMQRSEGQREQSIRIAERANEQAQRALQKISMSMPWWGLNLTNLNPDLGAYFGADHGVLVLSADADASKTLKSGDVLVTIGGKRVDRAEDALRLLREQPGKDIKVEVLRQRKTQVLSMRAPEFKTMFVPVPPAPPLAPMAPIAPIAPLPPLSRSAPHALTPHTPPEPPTPPALRTEPAPPAPASGPDDSEAPRATRPPTNSRIA